MQKLRRWVVFCLVSASLFSYLSLNIPVALAAPSVYYNSVYVGNVWTGPGTYDDSVPEEDTTDTTGEILANINNAAADFTKYDITGQLGSGATISVQYWYATISGGVIQSETQVSSATLSAANLNTTISVPSGVNELRFTATETANEGGQWNLVSTWSTDTQLSTTGQINWGTPPWTSSGGGGGTVTTTSVTGNTTTVDVSVSFPAPPNWDQITSEIADKILSGFPAVPAPPSGSGSITVPPVIQDPTPSLSSVQLTPASTQGLTNPPITAPQAPPETGATTYSFTDGYTPISVPYTGETPFTFSDPTGNLPHSPVGSMPIPGQTPASTLDPSLVGTTYPAPPYTVGIASSGPMPSMSSPNTTGGPVPTFSGYGGGSFPSPGLTGAALPGYTYGGSNLAGPTTY